MAYHNEILTGRHNRFIQRLFGMKGRSPAPQLSSEINVSHPLFHGRENRILESWNIWSFVETLGSSLGNDNGFRLRNPATSNVVAVIEKIALISPAAGASVSPTIELEQSNADLASPQVLLVKPLDGRIGTTQKSSMIASSAQPSVSIGTGAFVFTANQAVLTIIDVILHEDHQICIAPGFALNYRSIVANQGSGWAVYWRERALEETERTG